MGHFSRRCNNRPAKLTQPSLKPRSHSKGLRSAKARGSSTVTTVPHWPQGVSIMDRISREPLGDRLRLGSSETLPLTGPPPSPARSTAAEKAGRGGRRARESSGRWDDYLYEAQSHLARRAKPLPLRPGGPGLEHDQVRAATGGRTLFLGARARGDFPERVLARRPSLVNGHGPTFFIKRRAHDGAVGSGDPGEQKALLKGRARMSAPQVVQANERRRSMNECGSQDRGPRPGRRLCRGMHHEKRLPTGRTTVASDERGLRRFRDPDRFG